MLCSAEVNLSFPARIGYNTFSATPYPMFVPLPIIRFIAAIAWTVAGLVLFRFGLHTHYAAAELWNLEPFSQAALAAEQIIHCTALFGFAAGFAAFGALSDHLGRYRILLRCLTLAPLLSTLCCVSVTPADFLLLHFFSNACCSGLLLTAALLLYEQRDAAFRRKTLNTLPLLLPLLAAALALLPVQPIVHWRIGFAVLLPLLALPFLLKHYHDEPPRWKIAVRDNLSPVPLRYGKVRKRRRLLWCILLTAVGLTGSFAALHSPLASPLDLTAAKRGYRLDDRLIAYLVRYPQLLDTQTLSKLDWQETGERLALNREVPQGIFDGLMMLHQTKRPVNRQNLLDAALAAQDKRQGKDRSATQIPLDEAETFYKAAEDYLNETQNELERALAARRTDSYQSVAEQWKQRSMFFLKMLDELKRETQRRQAAIKTFQQIQFFWVCLAAGILLIFLRYVPSLNVLRLFPGCFITSYRGTGIGLAVGLTAMLLLSLLILQRVLL